MRFALNHIAAPGRPVEAFFAMARALGVGEVEIRNDLPDVVGAVAPEAVAAAAAAAGVGIVAINALYPFNVWSGDLPARAAALADYAQAAGARALVMCPLNDGAPVAREDLVAALAAMAPILRERGLVGLVEPLGFPTSSLRTKRAAVEAIDAAGAADVCRLLHDTFHHALAGETEFFPERTGLVHVSGVVDPDVAFGAMLDAHRALVDGRDRLGNLAQIRALLAAGYDGPLSFEPFAPEVHGLADPEAALRASIDYVEAGIRGREMGKTLDVITIGRSSVDLYGDQIGGRLEDMGSFSKYIGGSPTNIACGAARLGLRTAVITGVGDEHMGRFIVEQLAREGVDTRGVKVDPERLTALVLLGIRDDERFPLIFYRENCADMGLTEADIDEGFIAETRAVVATGTHLSHRRTEAAVLKALTLARKHGARTALDIDYRPNLWGVAGHGEGESRFVESAEVTRKLQSTLHLFDLIVGTEEEFHIAGGSTDTLEALRAVRAASAATLVCKRGAKGAVAFRGAIPSSLDDGEAGPGFPIEVFNVLGAGDGFFSGLLKGWMEDADWPTALKYANACGAFAVSRHGCTPAYPSAAELDFFLARGIVRPDLRNDRALEQIHWSTNRAGDWPEMRVFAFDHRMQLEEMPGATPEKIGAFKTLCLRAALDVADGRPGYGILCDNRLGRAALHAASGSGLWIGRPCEWPGSRPLTLEPELGSDCGGLGEWAREDVVKVLCFCHPDDDAATRAGQEETVRRLWEASRRNGLEFLLEIIPSRVGPVDDATTATLIRQFYAAGVWPDWWKLEPMTSRAAWSAAIAAIEENDAHTRGIVVLGLDAPEAALAASFETAAGFDLVKGFAVGRTIFGETARAWMRGETDDAAAVAEMARRYARLCEVWDRARASAREMSEAGA